MTAACDTFLAQIDDALDDRLSASDRAQHSAHARLCSACAAEWEFAASVRGSMLEIGLDRAPRELRGAISTGLRAAAAPGRSSLEAEPTRSRSFHALRAAAAVLVLVTGGFMAWKRWGPGGDVAPTPVREIVASAESSARDEEEVPARREAAARAVAWTADPAALPFAASDLGIAARVDDRASEALRAVREIADRGPLAERELDRIVTQTATPEHRQRQAEVLALLRDHVEEIATAEGVAPALARLGRDADEALGVFGGKNDAEKGAKDAAANEVAAAPKAEPVRAEERPSARKVTRRAPPPGTVQGSKASPDAEGPPATLPAFYVVSGPGAVGRVEKLLTDRQLAFVPVWLTEAVDERKRKIDAETANYRVVEVSVPESGLDELIGSLESLLGLRLAPVGAAGATGAPTSAPASAGPRKPLLHRKLRLILIGA